MNKTMGRFILRRSQRLANNKTRTEIIVRNREIVIKPYNHPYDPAKILINKQYAQWTKKYLGPQATHIILDSGHCVTSQHLHDVGAQLDRVYAPNINIDDCNALIEYGVNSPNMSIEEFISRNHVGARALWYDSQTNMGGSAQYQHYIGSVVDEFLKQNMCSIGHRAVIAISIVTRSSCDESIHGTSEYTFIEQIRRLIALRGFRSRAHWSSKYKAGMMYAIWTIEYNLNRCDTPLLKWKDGSKYIGFPADYVL
jgi:hypothetical protein